MDGTCQSSALVLPGRRGMSAATGGNLPLSNGRIGRGIAGGTFVSTRWPSRRSRSWRVWHYVRRRVDVFHAANPPDFFFPLAMFLRGRGAALCSTSMILRPSWALHKAGIGVG